MPSALVSAQIAAQAQLRELVAGGVIAAWTALPDYNEDDVELWLARVLPLIAAATRQSITLADAYVARALGRRPLGIDPVPVAAAARSGATPAEVYRRPFVTVWTALSRGVDRQAAIQAGGARAVSTARADVQLAQRAALVEIQRADPKIRGYRRRADPGACKFCAKIDGAFVKSATAMALHNGCGCALEPSLTASKASPIPDGVAVREHGEMGAYLGDPSHDFTSAADLS